MGTAIRARVQDGDESGSSFHDFGAGRGGRYDADLPGGPDRGHQGGSSSSFPALRAGHGPGRGVLPGQEPPQRIIGWDGGNAVRNMGQCCAGGRLGQRERKFGCHARYVCGNGRSPARVDGQGFFCRLAALLGGQRDVDAAAELGFVLVDVRVQQGFFPAV
jgi:hypothetical protein